jgi:DNA-binding transcriptional MerR regulator
MNSEYTIQEAGRLLGVSAYTLRYWEKMFCGILAPPRTAGGQRRYNREALRVAGTIYRLIRVEGYSIKGARKKLEGELQRETGSL